MRPLDDPEKSTVRLAALVAQAERELRAAGTAARAEHEKAYLKSSLEHAGASLPAIRGLAKRIRRDHPDLDASTVFALAKELWTTTLHERRMLAVMVLEQYADYLGPEHLDRLEPFLRDSFTWVLIDGLSGDVAATIVMANPCDPRVEATLRRWGRDDDFWVRRSALLAHLKSLGRRGGFQGWHRFCELADAMLDEREFFIRKAIGWVLREAGKREPDLVAEFLRPRVNRVSGVTIREAVRYLDTAERDALIAAYQNRSQEGACT